MPERRTTRRHRSHSRNSNQQQSITTALGTSNSSTPSPTTSINDSGSSVEKIKDVSIKKVCCFCGLSDEDEVEFGKFYESGGITTHYYCLLLSSNMAQEGNDDEGILGFLIHDIQKEIRRGKRLSCSYCRKAGATLGCVDVRCKKVFHFPCGLKAGSLHQFFGEFRSYCINHRPKQDIDKKVRDEIKNVPNVLCYICYDEVNPHDINGTIWAPCCKKNAFFHRKCMKQLAMSSGYFFKCPLCNNKRDFQTAMMEFGIYVPRQDASWELVPNAYEDLLHRHDSCDAAKCLCPKGRNHSSLSSKWELILCQFCGSQGTHTYCSDLKGEDPQWQCSECTAITNKSLQTAANNYPDLDEIRTRTVECSIVNITVNTDLMDPESSVVIQSPTRPRIRPGPRSFKLQQEAKLLQNQETPSEETPSSSSSVNSELLCNKVDTLNTPSPKNVICIDSDDDGVEILCESTLKKSPHKPALLKKINSFKFSNDTTPLKVSSDEEKDEEIPFNIIISHVTSIPPELFEIEPKANSASSVKRSLDESDSEAEERIKRSCREEESNSPVDQYIEKGVKNTPTVSKTSSNSEVESTSDLDTKSCSWDVSHSVSGMQQVPILQWLPQPKPTEQANKLQGLAPYVPRMFVNSTTMSPQTSAQSNHTLDQLLKNPLPQPVMPFIPFSKMVQVPILTAVAAVAEAPKTESPVIIDLE